LGAKVSDALRRRNCWRLVIRNGTDLFEQLVLFILLASNLVNLSLEIRAQA
jgi:hypothetical protein